MIIHTHTSFDQSKSCLICPNNNDTAKIDSEVKATGFLDKRGVHLSCHPDQPYHAECLKQWFKKNSLCPFDKHFVKTMKAEHIKVSQTTETMIVNHFALAFISRLKLLGPPFFPTGGLGNVDNMEFEPTSAYYDPYESKNWPITNYNELYEDDLYSL